MCSPYTDFLSLFSLFQVDGKTGKGGKGEEGVADKLYTGKTTTSHSLVFLC